MSAQFRVSPFERALYSILNQVLLNNTFEFNISLANMILPEAILA